MEEEREERGSVCFGQPADASPRVGDRRTRCSMRYVRSRHAERVEGSGNRRGIDDDVD